jgi:hypothetical protein
MMYTFSYAYGTLNKFLMQCLFQTFPHFPMGLFFLVDSNGAIWCPILFPPEGIESQVRCLHCLPGLCIPPVPHFQVFREILTLGFFKSLSFWWNGYLSNLFSAIPLFLNICLELEDSVSQVLPESLDSQCVRAERKRVNMWSLYGRQKAENGENSSVKGESGKGIIDSMGG